MASTSPAFIEMVPTPNPEEVGFRVRLEATGLFPSQLPKEHTPFNQCAILPNKQRVTHQDLGSYLYTMMEKADSYLWFYFYKSKTDEEKKVPFRSTSKFDDFTWPMVLKGIAVIPDDGFPQSTYAVVNGQKTLVSGPRYYGRELYIPEMSLPTKFTVDEFLSPTKFDIGAHPVPIPLPVNYEVLGVKREFPKCLHDDLELQSTRTGTAQVVAGNAGNARAGVIEGYSFPATNFKEWTAHYIHDDQQFTNGVWHRIRIRVTPPPMPKLISR